MRPSVLPFLRDDHRAEPRHPERGEARPRSPVRAAHGAEAAGQGEAVALPRGSPAVHAAERGARDPQVRPSVHQGLRLRRGAAATGRSGEVPRGDGRLEPGRGLRFDRGIARDPREPGRRRGKAGDDRAPRPGHGQQDREPRRPRPRSGVGRAWRALRPRTAGDAGVLEPAGGDRAHDSQRVAAHRRRRDHGPGRVLPDRRPDQGDDHRLRVQRVPHRGRGRAVPPPQDPQGQRGRCPRSGDR